MIKHWHNNIWEVRHYVLLSNTRLLQRLSLINESSKLYCYYGNSRDGFLYFIYLSVYLGVISQFYFSGVRLWLFESFTNEEKPSTRKYYSQNRMNYCNCNKLFELLNYFMSVEKALSCVLVVKLKIIYAVCSEKIFSYIFMLINSNSAVKFNLLISCWVFPTFIRKKTWRHYCTFS